MKNKNFNSEKITCLLEMTSKICLDGLGQSGTAMSGVYVATIVKNLESLGFTFSETLIGNLKKVSPENIVALYKCVLPVLKKMKGANKKYKPMYVNFPEGVMDAEDGELYLTAITHYTGVLLGENRLPEHEIAERFPLIGNYRLQVLDFADENAYETAISNLISSSVAISETHRDYVEKFYASEGFIPQSVILKNKENLAFVAGMLHKAGDTKSLEYVLKTPTDVLRWLTAISDGDISLAGNDKFIKLNRATRRMVLGLLDNMKNLAENMVKYRNKWIRVGEIVHPGEYAKRYKNAFKVFKALRDGDKIETFHSKTERLLNEKRYLDCASHLSARPGEFARKLDLLIRKSKNHNGVLKLFKSVSSDVSTNVLLNLRSHFASRYVSRATRMFFPKGSLAKVQVIENKLTPIDERVCQGIIREVDSILVERFSALDKLGKVYIDENLKGFNVPFALRSSSKASKTLTRGSSVKMDSDKKVIRLFTYWKNGVEGSKSDRVDIDLSSFFLDKDFSNAGHVSYTHLREGSISVHSGDITDAPNGAVEFIDVNIAEALEKGIRYVAMNVYSFTGQHFDKMNECFAGVMFRDNMNSGKIFEAKTVECKYDLTADSAVNIPLVFDLKERKFIWVDLMIGSQANFGHRIEGNKGTMADVVRGIVEISKPNLFDLFSLHAQARGDVVTDKDEADVVFDMDYALSSLPDVLTYI